MVFQFRSSSLNVFYPFCSDFLPVSNFFSFFISNLQVGFVLFSFVYISERAYFSFNLLNE